MTRQPTGDYARRLTGCPCSRGAPMRRGTTRAKVLVRYTRHEMKTYWFDFFSGGVPSLQYFLMQVQDLKKLAGTSEVGNGIDTTAELCVIGLAAYFEAFCKHEFAAVINICPETLNAFTARRECMVPARNLLHVISAPRYRLGLLIVEEYDFGSAKSVNGLFQDLLNITPFSKTEAKRYAEFLNDRNLFVHHGGSYTFKYAGKKFATRDIGARVHFDSLVVNKSDVYRWSNFLAKMATKIGNATVAALLKFTASQGLKCSAERKKAIRALGTIDPRAAASEMVKP